MPRMQSYLDDDLEVQLTTRTTDFFVVSKMSGSLVAFIVLESGMAYQDLTGDYNGLQQALFWDVSLPSNC